MNRPKAIGTAAETATVRALRRLGFPHAERRALTGTLDQGDVTGCPGVVWEVKGGTAAKTASDGQVAEWLAETERERVNAGADIGVLVLQRAGVGAANADRWWAVIDLPRLPGLSDETWGVLIGGPFQVRMTLATACTWLRRQGYGSELAPGSPQEPAGAPNGPDATKDQGDAA